MSLDLYILSETPIKKRSTGVFIRENGSTRELETKEEVKKYFPDAEDIQEEEYETNIVWHGNITHNLGEMADAVFPKWMSLKHLLWYPYTDVVETSWVDEISRCYRELNTNIDKYRKYEKKGEDGKVWGTTEDLLAFVRSLLHSLSEIDYKNEEYTIEVSR